MASPPLPSRFSRVFLLVFVVSFTPRSAQTQELYWEDPAPLATSGSRYVQAASGGGLSVFAWQEFVVDAQGKGGRLYLSLVSTRDFRSFTRSERFFGPIPYAEKEVLVFSIAITSRGYIYCAVLTGPTSVAVLVSRDGGTSFRAVQEQTTPTTTVAPYLAVTATDALLLFVTQTVEAAEGGAIPAQPITLTWSRSEDGQRWSTFEPLVSKAETSIGINMKPHHASWRNREYVVFQARNSTYKDAFYHLFLTWSEDGGKSWRAPKPLTFDESVGGVLRDEQAFDNQRPFMQTLGDRLAIAWERGYQMSGTRQVYYVELDPVGAPLDQINDQLQPAIRAGYRFGSANPQIILLQGKPSLLWFDTRSEPAQGRTGAIILADRGASGWTNPRDLTPTTPGTNMFGRPLVVGDQLYVAWDNQSGEAWSVKLLEPDHSVQPPQLRPVGFDPARRDRRSTVTVQWSPPHDSSGIDGFSYAWDRDEKGGTAEGFTVGESTTKATVSADEDGKWYFHVRARDRAGNWSAPASIVFFRDTTPPPPVAMDEPERDAKGFLTSNTFTLGWKPVGDDEIQGYSYRIEFLGPETLAVPDKGVALPPPPDRVNISETRIGRINEDNGTWALSVSAIDVAGNRGEPASMVFRLNKYVPVTYISSVSATVDRLGDTTLSLFGRGFSQGGLVATIFLDRDGQAPYDRVFDLESGIYTVVNDRLIDNIRIPEDIEPGTYRVGVQHPLRGVAFAPQTVSFVERGTVKLGDYTYSFLPQWESRPGKRSFFNASSLLMWFVVGFLAVLALATGRRLVVLAGEGRMLRQEVMAIVEGRRSPVQTRQEQLKEAARRGMGLRLKFSLMMALLVMLVVLIVSIPLSVRMLQTQRKTLATGLYNRIQILIGSIAIGAEAPLQSVRDPDSTSTTLPLSLDLPNQIGQVAEAAYILITGPGKELQDQNAIDFLWGYNFIKDRTEADVTDYLALDASPDAYGRSKVLPGSSLTLPERIATQVARVEENGRALLDDMLKEIERLNSEAASLAGKTDATSVADFNSKRATLTTLQQTLAQGLVSLKGDILTDPDFDLTGQRLAKNYEFVTPIVYTQKGDRRYVRGLVRLGVGTTGITEDIMSQQWSQIQWTGIFALAVLALGVMAAIVLASMIVAPIKRLAQGVAVIRDTEDKERLADHKIVVRTRDEIGTLAQTVNEMIQGLVAAAAASKELVLGQEIQRRFISLDMGADGRKGNVGGMETDRLEIFGFYEGAESVSGDYFEYVKLDDKHYAFIKGDVAGHGVAASLVMVELATLFSSFTRKWPQSKEKFRLDRFVYEVNDMLEVRGFKGRFAAFVVCILNIETGVSYLCNAGDKSLNYYDGTERKMKNLSLPSSPAAGVFPSSLVELQTGFQQIKHTLKPGDVFAFHTDGVEEDHRYFRDVDGNPLLYDAPDVEEERRHSFAPPKKGDENEMIETERLFGVLDACMNRSTYVMTKFYNPNPGEQFTFDFQTGAGSLREAVLAVMGMDKMFRVYRDATVGPDTRIRIDRNLLEVLRKHYVQFGEYFSHPVDDDGKSPQVVFSHLKEDPQFDDLTMLLVRRKT